MNRDLARALLLLYAAEDIIAKRRRVEEACGYPPEYGWDELLLETIRGFVGEKDEWSFKALREFTSP